MWGVLKLNVKKIEIVVHTWNNAIYFSPKNIFIILSDEPYICPR